GRRRPALPAEPPPHPLLGGPGLLDRWTERAGPLEIGPLLETYADRCRRVPVQDAKLHLLSRAVQANEPRERARRLDGPPVERDDDVILRHACRPRRRARNEAVDDRPVLALESHRVGEVR